MCILCLCYLAWTLTKDSEILISLFYRWNSTTHTFFIGCQEVSPSLKDVYEILRLPLLWDGEVANISLSPDEAKTENFVEDAVKKILKKPVLKATRKAKASSKEVPEDTSVGGNKGSRVNFWGWIRYLGRSMLKAWMKKPT